MHRNISVFALLLAVVALCSPETAAAQSITVGQSRIYLYATPGGFSQVESLSVSATSLPLHYEVQTQSGNNWLSTSSPGVYLPATLFVSANATLLQAGTYLGAITISAPENATVASVTVQVTLYVGSVASSAIAAAPDQLAFEAQAYGQAPSPKYVTLTGVSKNVSFFVNVATSDGYAWLQVNPLSSVTPANLAVTVNPGIMPAGEYTGTITITPLQGAPIVVDVSFQVAGANVVNVTPASLQFYYQTGKSRPNAQRVDFRVVDSPVSVTLNPTTASGGNWMKVTPTAFTTPSSSQVTVSPENLPAGTYEGNIAVMAQRDSTPVFNIPVKLTVGNGPLLTVSGSLSPFNHEIGANEPAGQILTVGSSSTPLAFDVSTGTSNSGEWLMVGPLSGTTPATLAIGIRTESLEPGTYTGTITISSSGAVNESQTVPVTLNVTGTTAIDVSPGSLYFAYQIDGANQPPTETLSITSTGQPVSILASPSTTDCSATWLRVSPFSALTPADLSVSVDTTLLTIPQICNGSIAVSGPDVTAPTRVPVMLTVSTQPLLNISPQQIRLTTAYGGAMLGPDAIDLTTTNNGAIPFTAVPSTTNGGAQWLKLSPASGNAPSTLSVTVNPASLVPGTYSGAIAIHSPGLPMPMSIPVVLTITPVASLGASATSLRFTQVQGGQRPASQQITLTADGNAVAYTVSTTTTNGSGWLSAASSSSATPGTLTVSASAGSSMAAGTYSGYVVITAPGAKNSPYRIPVTFVVSAPAVTVSSAPSTLSFTYQRGSTANPDPQKIRIAASGSNAVSIMASATGDSCGNWVSIDPNAATTPADLTVSVTPSGLNAGSYSCTIVVTPAAGVANAVSIPITLTVSAPPAPAVAVIVNAASGKAGPVAPGEIVMIIGQNLGPASGAGYHVGESGKLDTRLGSVRVLLGDAEAPLLYVSATQINAVVPYEIAGRSNVALVVENNEAQSVVMTVAVAESAPGIFTTSMGGVGQAAVLNQDNSYNSAAAPAPRGSVLQVFATGEGQTVPAGVTGAITKMDVNIPRLQVTATLGGAPARVRYNGSAPMAPAGLFQVNVEIPEDAPTGDVPIVITVGDASSQSGVTVAIR